MNRGFTENKSGAFVASQFRETKPRDIHAAPLATGITISYQAGSGAHEIAERAAGVLDQMEPAGEIWNVYDRQLIDRVLEDHFLPKQIGRHMPEDRRSTIQDVTEELLGLRPPSWVVVPMVAETILRLAQAGHAIIVGRGSAVVTASLRGVFHVRIVASLTSRLQRVQRVQQVGREDARQFIEREDSGSRRYVKTYFHAHIGDDLLYHLVINTDRVPYDEAVNLIVEGARRCFRDNANFQSESRQTKEHSL